MFNQATFRKILLISSGKVMSRIFKGYMRTRKETIKLADKKKLWNVTNSSN